MRLTTCIDRGVMRYHPPHNRLILDALVAAVLLTVRSSSSSLYIQTLPAFDSCLATHLSRKIEAETVLSKHRRSLGLPLFLSFLLLAVTILLVPRPNEIRLPNPDGTRREPTVVVAETTGRIERILIREGATVHTGDLLVQLDMKNLLLKRRDIEARIHRAERSSDRRRVGLSGLYRELQETQLDLGRLTITSPADGRLVRISSQDPGETLHRGSPIALILRSRIAQ